MIIFIFFHSVLPTPIFSVPKIVLSYIIFNFQLFSQCVILCIFSDTADLALIRGGLNVKEILTLCEFICPYINYQKANQ